MISRARGQRESEPLQVPGGIGLVVDLADRPLHEDAHPHEEEDGDEEGELREAASGHPVIFPRRGVAPVNMRMTSQNHIRTRVYGRMTNFTLKPAHLVDHTGSPVMVNEEHIYPFPQFLDIGFHSLEIFGHCPSDDFRNSSGVFLTPLGRQIGR